MKLKMYLRGLGIGIVVTALILGVSGGKEEMSDAEVIARAKELGMVEAEAVSKEVTWSNKEEQAPDAETEEEMSPSQSVETEKETLPSQRVETEKETSQSQSKETEKETLQSQSKETTEETLKTIAVTIVSGDDSAAASRRIYEAGVVDSAAELDEYLCSNGYSKKVVSGTYQIPENADHETIAKIITKSNNR